jgi:hypothetical protein
MQSSTNPNLVNILRDKDEDFSLPQDWAFVKKNKSTFLIKMEEQGRYEHVAAGKCITSCFTALKTSVVNVEESECMTNCMAKSLETKALWDHL